MQRWFVLFLILFLVFLASGFSGGGGLKPVDDAGKNRLDAMKALMELRGRDPELEIRFDENTGCVATINGNLTDPSQEDPLEIAYNFMDRYSSLLNVKNPRQEFVLAKNTSDEFGFTHIKFNQVWQGIPVWGAQIGVHLKSNGVIYYVNGSYYPSPEISVQPKISEQEGIHSAEQHYIDNGGSPVKNAKSDLMIYTSDGKDFKLVWHIVITGEKLTDGWEYFVDANSGEIIYRLPTIRYDGPIDGSGTDSHGTTRNLHLYQSEGTYYLVDATKAMYSPPFTELNGVIATNDFGHTEGTFSLATSPSTTVSDPAYVDLSYAYSEIYDFYYDLVGRNSWDNEGMTIRTGCHFGSNYNNAFWAGGDNNIFCFGDGDGTHFGVISGAFDVCCHEFQHAVTEASAGLIYHNQQGALNEAYSDIAASVFDPDWMIGEDIYTPSTPGDALRYMDDPHRADLPATMAEFVYLPDNAEGDWGGVHINMSIPCLAFVKMVDDEPHLSREDAYRIWYRSLTTYLTNSSDFMDGRDGVLRAAEDIYGTSPDWDDIECGIKDAFAYVQLGEGCGGHGSDSVWTGDFIYYWNDDAEAYYYLNMPELDPSFEAYGYGVRFTIPSGGYNVSAVFFFIYDVWTLYDMYVGIYDTSLTAVANTTIPNDDIWYAVYGDTMSYPLLGINWNSEYSGDFYVFTWLIGDPIYDDYVSFVVDDGTGSSEERNYYLDYEGYFYPLSELYGGEEYNIVAFACVTHRESGVEESAYLLPSGELLDLSAYPSPFNSTIRLSYSIPGDGEISIKDLSGRTVKNFSSLSGDGVIEWDASDENLPSGIYFASAVSDIVPVVATRKIIFLK